MEPITRSARPSVRRPLIHKEKQEGDGGRPTTLVIYGSCGSERPVRSFVRSLDRFCRSLCVRSLRSRHARPAGPIAERVGRGRGFFESATRVLSRPAGRSTLERPAARSNLTGSRRSVCLALSARPFDYCSFPTSRRENMSDAGWIPMDTYAYTTHFRYYNLATHASYYMLVLSYY